MAVETRIVQLGGTFYDAGSGGSPMDIWSCSFHLRTDAAPSTPSAMAADLASETLTFFTDVSTKIHATVALEYLKVSAIDMATGHWTSDPVGEVTWSSANRGAEGTITPVITTSCRISLDNGTRDRNAKGGFYLPRIGLTVGGNARFSSASVGNLKTNVNTWFTAMLAEPSVEELGVYSRVTGAFFPSTRFRIGDVPDNIRRRKNAMLENWVTQAL